MPITSILFGEEFDGVNKTTVFFRAIPKKWKDAEFRIVYGFIRLITEKLKKICLGFFKISKLKRR